VDSSNTTSSLFSDLTDFYKKPIERHPTCAEFAPPYTGHPMIKLITPPGLLLTVALLVIYCAYAFLIGSIEDSIPLIIGGGVAVVATYGTAMMRPWSQYLVYALAAGFSLKLGYSLYTAWTAGYFSFQFGSTQEIARSLASSAAMTVLSLLCCWLVYRHFRRTPITPTQAG
jgi:hypothetical protein